MGKDEKDQMESLVEAPNAANKKNPIDGVLVSESEFKGNKMLVLKRTPDDKYPLQMGKAKLRLILSNIDAIVAFLEKYEK